MVEDQEHYSRRWVEFLFYHLEELRYAEHLQEDLRYEFRMLAPFELCRCGGPRKLEFQRTKAEYRQPGKKGPEMPMPEWLDLVRGVNCLPRSLGRRRLELMLAGLSRAEVDAWEAKGRHYGRPELEFGSVYRRLARILNGQPSGRLA